MREREISSFFSSSVQMCPTRVAAGFCLVLVLLVFPVQENCMNVAKSENKYLSRIVGGEIAGVHEFPFAVLIANREGMVVCGGTLISPRYVLTAAHCVNTKLASNLVVRLGEHDLQSVNESRHLSVRVQEIISHPKFNYFGTNNDIALLRLDRVVALSSSVRSVCLPSDHSFDGQTALIVGWGHMLPSLEAPSTVLRKLHVQILNKTDCKQRLGTERWWLTDNKLCGWSYNQNACQGDSGGPVVPLDGSCVIGVMSFSVECGTTNMPSIYTRVSKFNQWILDNTTDHPPCIRAEIKF